MKPPLRVPSFDLHEGLHRLAEETARYVAKVHRARPGDELRVFDPGARLEADGVVVEVQRESVIVRLAGLRQIEPQGMPVTLLQALGKGDKPEQVIEDATVLGAERVVLVQTERSVVRDTSSDRARRWHRISVEAARQSGRGDLPELVGPVSLAEALDADRARDPEALRLVFAWHERTRPLLDVLPDWGARPLSLLVGPEGGLSAREVEGAVEAGFVPVGLGPLVLRTETAATVALGVARAWSSRTA